MAWGGHVLRREDTDVNILIKEMYIERKRGKGKKVVGCDENGMKRVGVSEDDARNLWVGLGWQATKCWKIK